MNADSGHILFEKQAREKRFPASLTKIATCVYTLYLRGEKLQTPIEIEHDAIAMISQEKKERSGYTLPSWWLEPGGTIMGLKKGDVVSIEELLWGTMLVSGGDACNAIALYIGGCVPDFMADLNTYLKEIGLENTHFTNPHGLHHPKHISTAYDLALLVKEGLKYPKFRQIVSSQSYERERGKGVLYQSNRLLMRGPYRYLPAIGVKTGHTQLAGYNLASAATSNGRTLIAILLGASTKEALYQETIALFKAAFLERKIKKRVLKSGRIDASLKIPGGSSAILPKLNQEIIIDFYPSEEPVISMEVHWDNLSLPVDKDQHVAKLVLKDEKGQVLQVAPLFATERVYSSLWERFKWRVFGGAQ